MLVSRILTSKPAHVLAATAIAIGCGRVPDQKLKGPELTTANVVTNEDPKVKQSIGDEANQFVVLGSDALKEGIKAKTIAAAQSPKGSELIEAIAEANGPRIEALSPGVAEPSAAAPQPQPKDSLRLGFPVRLINQGQIFGGIITKVSDHESESLGRLKLMELESLHVRPMLAKDTDNNFFLALKGCAKDCGELAAQEQIFAIPIQEVSEDGELVYLDLAALGKSLSLIGMLDPDGGYTKLKEKFSKTTFVDFSSSTLVFDIESHMIPLTADPEAEGVPETVLTVRWYMKLESGLNTAFEVRRPEKGVGFFGTTRNANEKIVRHSLTQFSDNKAPVFYYIKGVPGEYQADFSASFEHWNTALKDVMGRDILGYKHVTDEEASSEQLVAGDVRFNILEWDRENIAPYGGLGPSIASQNTGETFSSNVLVQGPTIVTLYKKWFQIQDEVQALRADGREREADAKVAEFKRSVEAKNNALKNLPKVEIKLGKLKMSAPALDPRLEDPAMARMDFYETPEGETYGSYMTGYWQELVTHELGHNLGLRHNFRGNLGADDDGEMQSTSVMEYLGRPYRHKNKIGAYDKMALAYGYAGKAPTRLDMYCTDEQVPSLDEPKLSAECSRDDATNDPFAMLLGNLKRSIDLGIGRSSPYAPNWTVDDIKSEVTKAATGLGLYASSATDFSGTWTNWQKGGRPTVAAEIPAYVALKIKSKLCDPSIDVVVRGKESEAAKKAALENLQGIRTSVYETLGKLGIGDSVRCQ